MDFVGDFMRAIGKPEDERTEDEVRAYETVRSAGRSMGPLDRRAQAVSFAWGNANIEDPGVRREDFERAYDELYACG